MKYRLSSIISIFDLYLKFRLFKPVKPEPIHVENWKSIHIPFSNDEIDVINTSNILYRKAVKPRFNPPFRLKYDKWYGVYFFERGRLIPHTLLTTLALKPDNVLILNLTLWLLMHWHVLDCCRSGLITGYSTVQNGNVIDISPSMLWTASDFEIHCKHCRQPSQKMQESCKIGWKWMILRDVFWLSNEVWFE